VVPAAEAATEVAEIVAAVVATEVAEATKAVSKRLISLPFIS
jgi:hypothetical protein